MATSRTETAGDATLPAPRRRRSLRWRLIAVVMASMVVTLATISAGILTHEYIDNRETAVTAYRVQAAMIARNASVAVRLDDRQAGLDILGALEASPHVLRADLRDPEGRLLVVRAWERPAPIAGSDVLVISQPILVQDVKVGSVQLEVEMGWLREQIVEYVVAMVGVALAAGLAGYLVLTSQVQRLLEPLDRLARMTRRVTLTGDFRLRAPEESRDEIGELARGINEMLSQIQVRDEALAGELVQRREAEGRLAQLAHFDPVTQLPNRHYFNERIERVLEDSRILGAKTALLLLDVDDFKLVNDSLGHHVGDRLLQEIGRCVKQQVRATDTVARLGGDEFAVILEHVRGREEPRHVVEKILAALARPLAADGHSVHVGVSVGVALFPADATSVGGLLRRADTALYDAKARGKRGYRFFEPEMDQRMRRRLQVESELRQALRAGELFVQYQPQVNLLTGRHAGLEALVRWRHLERGVIGPMEFIPVAEESGLIDEVGQFVLVASHAQARVWREQGLEAGQLAINVSPRQFDSDDFVGAVLGSLERHGMEPSSLELEITESLVMGGSESIARIERLHEAGVRFAIDDFGTGYSSLGYLKRAPISTLKIDRHFTRQLGEDAEDRAITQAVIAMGQSLGLATVAEGVESGAGLDLLRRMGCTMAQGYVIAPPLATDDVPAFVRHWTAGPSP